MLSILQGSNDPLILEVDELTGVSTVSAGMYAYGICKKAWDQSEITINENHIILPLSERETLQLGRGIVTLDVKGLTEAGEVVFLDLVNYTVVERHNKTPLTPDSVG